MELMMILATIILIVTLIRISSSLTAIRGAFGRLEIMLAKLAADTAAIRKQGEGVLPPAPVGHPPSQRGVDLGEIAAGHPPSRRGVDLGESSAGHPSSERVDLGEIAVGHPPSERGVAQRAGGSTPGIQEADGVILAAFAPAAGTGRAGQEEIPPQEPTKFELWAKAAWDWLRVGEEWRPGWIPGEYVVAAVQLLRAAAVLLLFGAAWFVRYVHEQGWFSPTGRVIGGFVVAAVLVAFGSRLLRRQWRPLGLVLAGLGFALGEFIDWAGANLYGVLPAPAAFAIAAVLALGAGAMAWRHSSLILGLVALFAGYSAPWFFPEAVRGGDAALLAWLLLLAAEAAVLAVTRGWRSLPWISLVAGLPLAWPVLWPSIWSPCRLDALGRGWALSFLAVFAVLSWVQGLGNALWRRRSPFWFDLAHWAVATFFVLLFATTPHMTATWPLFAKGLPALAFAVGSLAVFHAFQRRGVRDRITSGCLLSGVSALSLCFLCLSFDGTSRCIALSAAAVAFVWIAARRGSAVLSVFAVVSWILWIVHVGTPETAAARIGRIAPAVASLWAAGLLLRRMKAEGGRFAPALLWAAWAASLVWGTWEVNHAFPDFTPSIALYWGIHALATLVVGLLFNSRYVRGAALCLFGAAAGKFLLIDQAGAPTPERVAGFLGVGLLLLLGSAGYIRAAGAARMKDEVRRTNDEEKDRTTVSGE